MNKLSRQIDHALFDIELSTDFLAGLEGGQFFLDQQDIDEKECQEYAGRILDLIDRLQKIPNRWGERKAS